MWKKSTHELLRLVNSFSKLRLLTWDHNVKAVKAELEAMRITLGTSGPPIGIFGFKNIKGLEFEHVAIVDFFSAPDEIYEVLQKHWKFALQVYFRLFCTKFF